MAEFSKMRWNAVILMNWNFLGMVASLKLTDFAKKKVCTKTEKVVSTTPSSVWPTLSFCILVLSDALKCRGRLRKQNILTTRINT